MKNTRINWRAMRSSLGEVLAYPLSKHESQVYVWCRAVGEFSITVDFVNGDDGEIVTIPVAYGSSVDGAYSFDGAVALNIIPKNKGVRVAAIVTQTPVNRRETISPIPKRLVIPTSQDTFEQRLLRQFTDLLDQRTGGGTSRGYDYKVHDEYSDSDPDYGPGYEVDEELEQQLDSDIAARRSRASKSKPEGVQPSDLSNNDKRNRGKLDVQPATGDPAPNPDQSERIAALESALRELRKSPS